jgi:putative alpha-1,2-mannosidase
MVKNAEVVPYNTFSNLDLTGSVKEGRGALLDWLSLGYLSVDRSDRSISRSVEYSLNDYALSVVAKGEAPGDVSKYLNRSANWQNLWSDKVTSHGFTGFMAPRLSNGTFNLTDYSPGLCGGCEWSSITYEGTPWEYSFTIPHDMITLIQFMGGDTKFEDRLDYIVGFFPSLPSPFGYWAR